jgi:hypothetical protein
LSGRNFVELSMPRICSAGVDVFVVELFIWSSFKRNAISKSRRTSVSLGSIKLKRLKSERKKFLLLLIVLLIYCN